MTEYPFLLGDVTALRKFRENIFAAKAVGGQRAPPATPTAPKAVLKFISFALSGPGPLQSLLKLLTVIVKASAREGTL